MTKARIHGRRTRAMALALLPVVALLTITHLTAPQAGAQVAEEGSSLTPNFKDVDIRQVVETVSEVTGRNFLLDARVKGNVTMISDSAMSPDAFYETFLSILEVYGFVAVPSGDIIKIIPDTNARQVPGPSGSLRRDDIVTEVIQVENVGAAQLVPILRPLIPQYGHLAAHPASNMLIVADRAANVARLKRIIRRIDQSGDEDIEVIRMEHASATDVVRIMSTLNQAASRGGGDPSSTPLSLVADERTNSVLISGDRAQRLRFRALITHLDTPLEEGGNTQVIYLRYANAEELATKLTEQVRGNNGPAGGQGAAAANQNNVIIWADPGTNALVMTAPPKLMRSLRGVIDKIDIRRAQVHVEAILAEVSDRDGGDLGITWLIDGSNVGAPAGGTTFGRISAATVAAVLGDGSDVDSAALGSALAGTTGVVLGGGRFNSSEGLNFGVLAEALITNSNTNILSAPSIVTMDNEEAEISVGREVPFQTGSFTNTGGTTGSVNPFTTIQREQVGIKLKITPQINEGNAVILSIELESSELEESGEIGLQVTSERTITQRVIVDDGGVVVLGGLISDTLTETRSGVPILSKIPILGALFRADSSSADKRNLMVFIRPKILRDSEQSALTTNQKYNFIRDTQLDQRDSVWTTPKDARPVLPPLEDLIEKGFQRESDLLDLREGGNWGEYDGK